MRLLSWNPETEEAQVAFPDPSARGGEYVAIFVVRSEEHAQEIVRRWNAVAVPTERVA
jgi:hypothetical protein